MTVELLERTTCPHCWTSFDPEDVLWISSHSSLRGDHRLTTEALRRFLPSRFTVLGEAIDAQGLPCTDLACPRCHLSIPQAALEMEPYFVSVLGAPSSGKSYFLTAMTWELSRHLPSLFAVNVTDADPAANLTLTKYEQNLFMNPDGRALTPLKGLIEKTQINQMGHFDTVTFAGQNVKYPRPFTFALKPSSGHANVAEAGRISRLLCFYDIAGEHCLPGADSYGEAATRHLAASHLLLFLFDPLQDARFRSRALASDNGVKAKEGTMSRQETILHEAAARVRRYTGLAQSEKHNRSFVVVVTKSDGWQHLIDCDIMKEPWARGRQHAGLNITQVETVSLAVRDLLLKYCPNIVHVAEDFADPLYVPVTALGCQPDQHTASGEPALRPAEIKPRWVTVPLMAGSRDVLSSLIFQLRPKADGRKTHPAQNSSPGITTDLKAWLEDEKRTQEAGKRNSRS